MERDEHARGEEEEEALDDGLRPGAMSVAVKEPEQVVPITCSRQCVRETERGVNSPT